MTDLFELAVTPDFSGEFAPGCGPIDKPGIYHIPIEKYHGGPCVQPSLSSTGMSFLTKTCPAKFWHQSPMNPEQVQKDAKHFRLGRLAHTLLLERDKLDETFHVSSYKDLRSNAAKEERDRVEASGLTWVKEAEVAAAAEMIEAAARQGIVEFFDGCVAEASLIWQDERTGVWLRVRPDGLPLSPGNAYIGDYKTAADANPFNWERHVGDYGYHISAWLYQEGVRQVLGVEPAGFIFFVQEKDAPYLVSVMEISAEDVARGGMMARQAIDTYAACLESGNWPDYRDLHGFREVYLPRWQRDKIDAQAKAMDEPEPDEAAVVE